MPQSGSDANGQTYVLTNPNEHTPDVEQHAVKVSATRQRTWNACSFTVSPLTSEITQTHRTLLL